MRSNVPVLVPCSPCSSTSSSHNDDSKLNTSNSISFRTHQPKHSQFKVIPKPDAIRPPIIDKQQDISCNKQRKKKSKIFLRKKRNQLKKAFNNGPFRSLDSTTSVEVIILSGATNAFTEIKLRIPIGLISLREQDMKYVASKQQNQIESTWNGSLIYKKMEEACTQPSAIPSITINLPSDEKYDFCDIIQNILLRFYKDGIIHCSDCVQGPDVLYLLDFFQIVLFPSQMKFENINVYLRVRMFADYLLFRDSWKEFILHYILRGNLKKVAFVVSNDYDEEYVYKGEKLEFFLSENDMVMEFFSPLNGDMQNERYRNNFANYIQMSLPRASVSFHVEIVKRCGKDGLTTSRESGIEKRAVLYVDLTTSNEFILLNELKQRDMFHSSCLKEKSTEFVDDIVVKENMECKTSRKNQYISENETESSNSNRLLEQSKHIDEGKENLNLDNETTSKSLLPISNEQNSSFDNFLSSDTSSNTETNLQNNRVVFDLVDWYKTIWTMSSPSSNKNNKVEKNNFELNENDTEHLLENIYPSSGNIYSFSSMEEATYSNEQMGDTVGTFQEFSNEDEENDTITSNIFCTIFNICST